MSDKNKKTADTAEESDRSPKVGALLRASRLRVGEDLRDVSEDLCIRFLYLEAIEDCRYSDLPGDTYAIGFIRSYAEHLGLDGEEVVRRYRAEQVSGKRLSDLSFPTPVPESGVPKGAIVFVGVVLAVLVYGGWYVTTTDESILSDLISPVPDRLQHLVDEDQKSEASTGATSPDPSVEEQAGSTPADDTAPRVRQETQKALDANTAEALAEATEAARESIETPAETTTEEVVNVTDQATETASTDARAESADTPPVEAETAQQPVQSGQTAPPQTTGASVSGTATPLPSQNNAGNSGATAIQRSEGAVREAASTEVATEPASQTEPSATGSNSDTASQISNETLSTPSASTATELAETGTPPSVTERTNVTSTNQENAPAASPGPEVTAEDLNARSLQAATTGGPTETEREVASTVSNTASASPTPPSTSEQSSGNGIVIRAIESSWVQVTDPASGEVVFTGLMSPGSTYAVPSREGLLLDTGNAGAIDIIVNGSAVPKLGGVGSVRKGVALDRDRLIAGTAVNR